MAKSSIPYGNLSQAFVFPVWYYWYEYFPVDIIPSYYTVPPWAFGLAVDSGAGAEAGEARAGGRCGEWWD